MTTNLTPGADMDKALADVLGLETIDKEGVAFTVLIPTDYFDSKTPPFKTAIPGSPSTDWVLAVAVFRHEWNKKDSALRKYMDLKDDYYRDLAGQWFDTLMDSAEDICQIILDAYPEAEDE